MRIFGTLCLSSLLLSPAEARSAASVLASRPDLSQFLDLMGTVNASHPSSAASLALFSPAVLPTQITVFAPNNVAFDRFAEQVGGFPPKLVLEEMLHFHLLEGVVSLTQNAIERVTFFQNQSLFLSSTKITGGAPSSSAVLLEPSSPLEFASGNIFVIDSVLKPFFQVQDFMKVQEQEQNKIATRLEVLSGSIDANSWDIGQNSEAIDAGWMLTCAMLVFFMQAGFAMFETGCIPQFSTRNVLFKNILDAAISSLGWWAIGFSISFNEPENQPIMGSAHFFAHDSSKFQFLMFGWGFCATTATIDSGATIGRIKLPIYLSMNLLSGWVLYPFFSHWVWGGGFLQKLGFIDFAGSGVIHLTGGVCGFVAAYLLGPRDERWGYNDAGERVENFTGSSIALMVLGTFILFFCWFGFNCGSSMQLTSGHWEVAATAGINTFLSPSCSVMTMLLYDVYIDGTYSVENTCNAVLAGLVAITAGCATCSSYGSCIIGILTVPLYLLTSKLLVKNHIDDPVDVFAVHGVQGAFGVLAVAFFSTPERLVRAGFEDRGFGEQFGVQCIGLCVIAFTAMTLMGTMLLILKKTVGIRVNITEEKVGLDYVYHGSGASLNDKLKQHRRQMSRERAMKNFKKKEETKMNRQNSNSSLGMRAFRSSNGSRNSPRPSVENRSSSGSSLGNSKTPTSKTPRSGSEKKLKKFHFDRSASVEKRGKEKSERTQPARGRVASDVSPRTPRGGTPKREDQGETEFVSPVAKI